MLKVLYLVKYKVNWSNEWYCHTYWNLSQCIDFVKNRNYTELKIFKIYENELDLYDILY